MSDKRIVVWVFGDRSEFDNMDGAMAFANDADYRYAHGFVQVFDTNGRLVFGRPQ